MNYASNYIAARDAADKIREKSASGQRVGGLGSKTDTSVGLSPLVKDKLGDIENLSAAYLASFDDVFGTTEEDPLSSIKPVSPLEGLGGGALEGDLEFMDAVASLEEKFPGLNRRELFRIIAGESKFDPTATNKHNMAGLFQISPDAAEELGTSTEEILRMSPTEQVNLYGRYLEKWDWNPSIPLAIMQAAPSKAKYLKNPGDVVYEVGSKEWRANKGWRSTENGPITLRSLKRYYGG